MSTTTLNAGLITSLQHILPDMPLQMVTDLLPHFRAHQRERFAPLLNQGEVWQSVDLIESGLVRMYFLRRDGREFNKSFFAEHSILCPLTPSMWQAPSLFGIACVEPLKFWRCDSQVFRDILYQHGQWLPFQNILLSHLLTAKLQREHDLLALDGRRRYEAFCAQFPTLAQRIPLGHLATYLGLTDVSLSRLRRQQRELDS